MNTICYFNNIEFFIVIIIALSISVLVYAKKLLTLDGAVGLFVMLILIELWGKWQMVALILFGYLTLSVVDKAMANRIEESVKDIHEKTGARTAYQVWINGGVGVVCLLFYELNGNKAFLLGYIAAIGEAYADSMASDVGVMSKKRPFDICTLKPIANGLSGGISLLGTFSSAVGCTLYSLLAVILTDLPVMYALYILLLSMAGCFFDSFLGSKYQVKFRCGVCGKITEKRSHCGQNTEYYSGTKWLSNSLVNLFSNAFSAIITVVLFLFAI